MFDQDFVDTLISKGFNVYPKVLGFSYLQNIPDISNKFVFIHSDFGIPINQHVKQFLTGADNKNTYSWCALDFSNFKQMPNSEYTETPTVGFVGRIPIFEQNSRQSLHRGFEARYNSYITLYNSTKICFDGHARFEPLGDSAGFWNNSIPNKQKWEPLFKTNMLANQYALTARGNGNYAQRLYEALAYGRILVYIDSGGKMPFDNIIDYKSFDCFVWVKESEIPTIEQKILEFHETHDLKQSQNKCRKIYEDCLTFDSQIKLFEDYYCMFEYYI